MNNLTKKCSECPIIGCTECLNESSCTTRVNYMQLNEEKICECPSGYFIDQF